jgi:hypothetical protein
MFYSEGHGTDPVGMLALNAAANDGSGTVHANAAGTPNSNFIIDFWPFGQSEQAMYQVGSFSTDENGNINAIFHFPGKGNFAGSFPIFIVNPDGRSQYFGIGPNPFDSAVNYSAPLLPASSISGGVNGATGTAAGSGRVTVTGNSAVITLAGALPSHSFKVRLCGTLTQCFPDLGTMNTDAKGNANATLNMNGTGPSGGSFVLTDSAGAEYISGFHVQ